MLLVKNIDQNFWVGHAADPLLKQGICMSICYEWARRFLLSQSCDLGDILFKEGPEWQRRLSFQRAYDGTWYDTGRQQDYPDFFLTLANATSRFLTQNAPHDGMSIREIQRTAFGMLIQQELQSIPLGKAYLLLISGDGNPSEPKGIWGHVVAVANPDRIGATAHHFDPNRGLYKFADDSNLGEEVMRELDVFYRGLHHLTIRDYMIFQCGV